MTQEKIVNELKYKLAFSFLRKLLTDGKITNAEFKVADQYTAKKYQSNLIIL
jgi:hypothetical protein